MVQGQPTNIPCPPAAAEKKNASRELSEPGEIKPVVAWCITRALRILVNGICAYTSA